MATIDEIKQQAEAVKNATQVGENTAMRVGGALSGLAEIAEQQDSKLSDLKHGEIINGTNNNAFFQKSAFTEVVGAPTIRANYYFGVGLDERPQHVPDEPNACKYEITLSTYNQPVYIYLEDCGFANSNYRTWAVFYGDNNAIVSEGVCSGDKVLSLPSAGKYTILATCKRILKQTFYAKFPSLNGTLLNLQDSKFDKSNVVQETGYATDKVMSQNAVSGKLSDLSISTNNISIIDDSYFDLSNFTEAENVETNIGLYIFGQGLNETPHHPTASFTKKFSKSIEGAGSAGVYLYLKDCHAANKDYRTYAVYDKNGKLIREGVSTTNVVLYIERSFTVLAFCEGIYYANVYTAKAKSVNEKILDIERNIKSTNSLLNGKTIWTLWDSLGQNTWQNHFTEISGTIFHEDLNLKADKPLSWGGSSSDPSSDDATQQRALNLISYKDSYPIDYVFIENINDRGNRNFGTIEDKPFMRSQRIIYSSGTEFVDYNSANTYLENNKSEIIKTIQNRKVGTIISIPYQGGSAVRGSKVKFLTRPTLEGDISISVNGNNFSVHVNTAMTIQDVVDEFIKYSYGPGWTDVDNRDGSISIFYYTETSFNITFDGGNTGVTANVEDTSGGGYVHTYYLGENIDDINWNDVNNWGNGVTLFSIYKGIIEYLQKEIPQAKLYWVAPFSIGVDFSASTYKKSDGSWSQDKYRQSELYKSNRKLYEVQKAVCEYYDILFLDLDSKSGMSIINIENYFNTNNVHPKKVGYDRYAEAILNLM